MNYVATNIRFPEEDWKYFKIKALEARKSLAAWIRDSLREKEGLTKKTVKSQEKDSFWEFPELLKKNKIRDKAPKNLSLNLDQYLYGQE
ncbi:MAG: hypothetical protein ABIB61_00800 [Candidatus Shapirobacteria bacterium]